MDNTFATPSAAAYSNPFSVIPATPPTTMAADASSTAAVTGPPPPTPGDPTTFAPPAVFVSVDHVAKALKGAPVLGSTSVPTFRYLLQLIDHLIKGVTTLPCSDGGRLFLAMILPDQQYSDLFGAPYVFPAPPSILPEQNETRLGQDQDRIRAYTPQETTLLLHAVIQNVETALRNVLLQVIPGHLLPDSFHTMATWTEIPVWPASFDARELIRSLLDEWDEVTEDDCQLFKQPFSAPWNVKEHIKKYFQRVDRAILLAVLMDEPFTNKQKCHQASRTIHASAEFSKAKALFKSLPRHKKSYSKFKEIYTAQYLYHVNNNIAIKSPHRAPMESVDHNAFLVVHPNDDIADDASLTSLQSLSEGIQSMIHAGVSDTVSSAVTTAVSALTEQQNHRFALLASEIRQAVQPPAPASYLAPAPPAYQAPPQPRHTPSVPAPTNPYVPPAGRPAPANPYVPTVPQQQNQDGRSRRNQNNRNNPPNNVKTHANHLYCASCGCDVDHSSPDCKSKVTGHRNDVIHKEQAKLLRDQGHPAKGLKLVGYHKTHWPVGN